MRFRSFVISALALSVAACMPPPLSQKDRLSIARNDLRTLFRNQEPVKGPIGLYEAMARTLKYNMDRRIRAMEAVYQSGQFDLAKFSLLPQMNAGADFTTRNNWSGSRSRSLLTGRESLEPSTSTDKHRRTADIKLVWSLLDFGVSYVRLQQEGNRVHIADETRRKITNTIVDDVRRAYWRLVAAECVAPLFRRVRGAAYGAIARARRARRSGDLDPLRAVGYQRRMLRTIRDITRRQRELALARAELAALMNLDPRTPFKIKRPRYCGFKPLALKVPVGNLRTIALVNRPELYEADYNDRIVKLEDTVQILDTLPGISLNVSGNYDSNSFLYNNLWAEFGARVTVQIAKLLTLPTRLQQNKARRELYAARRRALTLAIVTQVHLAHQTFHLKRKEYRLSRWIGGVEGENYRLVRNARKARVSDQAAFVEALASLANARLESLQAYADLQAAYGRVLRSVGVTVPPVVSSRKGKDGKPLSPSVAETTATLKAFFERDFSGRLRRMATKANALMKAAKTRQQSKSKPAAARKNGKPAKSTKAARVVRTPKRG